MVKSFYFLLSIFSTIKYIQITSNFINKYVFQTKHNYEKTAVYIMNIYYELKSPKNRTKEVTNLNSADVISWWKH